MASISSKSLGTLIRIADSDGGQGDANYEIADINNFVSGGAVYFARQAVTAMEHQPPGSTGMEAIYGVRPIPDDDGVYPYVYNMAAVAGMRVRENGETYVCTRDIDPLLYPPSQVAAHFTKE